MPTTRRRVPRYHQDIAPEALAWLNGGDGGAWANLASTTESRAELWIEHGGAIVAADARKWPGSRPIRWWEYNAPEPRQRVGGVGTPAHEPLAYVLELYLGVPVHWITADVAHVYKHHLGCDLGVPALDPADPPTFESEAHYLRRLGLLLPGEARRLRSADFKPQSVLDLLAFQSDELEVRRA